MSWRILLRNEFECVSSIHNLKLFSKICFIFKNKTECLNELNRSKLLNEIQQISFKSIGTGICSSITVNIFALQRQMHVKILQCINDSIFCGKRIFDSWFCLRFYRLTIVQWHSNWVIHKEYYRKLTFLFGLFLLVFICSKVIFYLIWNAGLMTRKIVWITMFQPHKKGSAVLLNVHLPPPPSVVKNWIDEDKKTNRKLSKNVHKSAKPKSISKTNLTSQSSSSTIESSFETRYSVSTNRTASC